MAISDCPSTYLNTLLDLKDDQDESDENENSSEEDLITDNDIENNETDSGTSAVRNVKNYFKVSGIRSNDIIDWEEEVEGMMESVRNIHEGLAGGLRIEDVFGFQVEESLNQKQIDNEDDLKASFEEIGKMDAILRIKVTEEKKAKLSRIQAEKESRDILSKLPCAQASNRMKVNFEEFMRLLNEVDKPEDDFSPLLKEIDLDGLAPSEGYEEKAKEEEKKEKVCDQPKTSNQKFVERNIQLAKCGRGTLSLTDEEKSRIENLMVDFETTKDSNAEKDSDAKKESYAIDDETKSILIQIDEKLEVLARQKIFEKVEHKLNLMEIKDSQKTVLEEEEKEYSNEERRKGNKKPVRLKEIDKLLNSMNSISSEEISPLTEEQIETLIEQSKQCLVQESTPAENVSKAKVDWATCKPPQEVIAELVSSAKSLMPKFKYRFNDS